MRATPNRPRVDPEVHRAQLAAFTAVCPQPRQPAEPHHQLSRPVRTGQPTGDRRPLQPVRFPEPTGEQQPPRPDPARKSATRSNQRSRTRATTHSYVASDGRSDSWATGPKQLAQVRIERRPRNRCVPPDRIGFRAIAGSSPVRHASDASRCLREARS